jgi:hypothetical protein
LCFKDKCCEPKEKESLKKKFQNMKKKKNTKETKERFPNNVFEIPKFMQ